jgi:predicted DNA-binding transcriptional regulator AlpA
VKYLVPVDEFADGLGRSVRSIYDARYRGSDLPPGITIGGRLYFHQSDVDNWLDRKRAYAHAEKTSRQQAITRPLDRGGPRPKNLMEKSREPRSALTGNRGSLSGTAGSKGLSYDQG